MGKIGLEKLTRLASLWGIENGYYTIKGQWIDAPLETMQRILVSMGEDVSDETKIEQSIREREKELSFPILPVMVTRERTVRFPRGEGWTSVELQMISEQDEMFFFHWSSDETIEITLPPELSWGYYRLLFSIQIFGEPLRRESFLIFTRDATSALCP
ncbi:MAG: hypothetical protein NTX88_01875 [Candidatus Atribacteria bacterium]|nr:hypothetical protein [Candidatus Atribacteria bacterium]